MRTLTGMQGIGGARELAEMLRQMGRGPDTMLAHITPDEAQMLLEEGGSGRINPMTGLPEFQPEVDPSSFEDYYYNYQEPPTDYLAQARAVEPPGYYGTSQTGFNQGVEAAVHKLPMTDRMRYDTMPFGDELQSFQYTGFDPTSAQTVIDRNAEAAALSRGLLPSTPVAQPSVYDVTSKDYPQAAIPTTKAQSQELIQEKGFRDKYPMLARILGTTALSLPAVYFANRARREGRSAARQLESMAAPIRAEAEALRRQATTGGLTPQQAQREQARRASMLQAAETRSGTSGTQQAMIENTLARERAGLAQTNLENALRQLNLANTVTESAIRARLASDRDVDRYLTNIYTNLIRSSQGQRPMAMYAEQGGNILPEQRIFTEPSAKG